MAEPSKLELVAKLVLAGSLTACILTGLVVNSIRTDNRTANEKNKKEEQVTIPLSDYKHYGERYIRYCGMPNEERFSLSEISPSAINIYYPKNAKQIPFLGNEYEVISVDPNQITLKDIE